MREFGQSSDHRRLLICRAAVAKRDNLGSLNAEFMSLKLWQLKMSWSFWLVLACGCEASSLWLQMIISSLCVYVCPNFLFIRTSDHSNAITLTINVLRDLFLNKISLWGRREWDSIRTWGWGSSMWQERF